MREKLARFLLTVSSLMMGLSFFMLWQMKEPFYTYFYIFVWWSYIGILESWLYLKAGEGSSLFFGRPYNFVTFLVPFSAFLWFIFECFNLRMQNWVYVNVPQTTWIRWLGNFLAFGTVLPGIFSTANLLDYLGVFRKNEFSQFFTEELSTFSSRALMSCGVVMLALPVLFPGYFFPLVWGGFVLLLDPVNAGWNGSSLIQEWRQKNWNRTLQLLSAGLICGGLWEFWNFWAGTKWIYTVPLPEPLLKNLKIFEMPVLGFLGFPPFALECFVMAEFAKNVRERAPFFVWRLLTLSALLFALLMCWFIDQTTVKSFR